MGNIFLALSFVRLWNAIETYKQDISARLYIGIAMIATGDTITSRNLKRQFFFLRNCAIVRPLAGSRQTSPDGPQRTTHDTTKKIILYRICCSSRPRLPFDVALCVCAFFHSLHAFLLCLLPFHFITVSVISIQINNHRWHRNRNDFFSPFNFFRYFRFIFGVCVCAHWILFRSLVPYDILFRIESSIWHWIDTLTQVRTKRNCGDNNISNQQPNE